MPEKRNRLTTPLRKINRKNQIVPTSARALMAACAFFIFTSISNAGPRYEVYVNANEGYGGSAYGHAGTVTYNCHSCPNQSRGVFFENWADANAWFDYQSRQNDRTVTYSTTTTSSGRCGEYGNPPCKSKNANVDPRFQALIDSVEHQISDSVLWSKLKSVVVIDEVYAQTPGSAEGTLIGTAAYVQLDTGYVVREIGHTFPTLLEAQTYLDNRASSGAVVIYVMR